MWVVKIARWNPDNDCIFHPQASVGLLSFSFSDTAGGKGTYLMCIRAKSHQPCLILCDPMDSSPAVSSLYGMLWRECWSGLPCPPPGDLPDPRIEPVSLMSPALAGRFLTSATWEAHLYHLANLGPIIYVFSVYFMFIEFLQVLSAICSAVTQW